MNGGWQIAVGIWVAGVIIAAAMLWIMTRKADHERRVEWLDDADDAEPDDHRDPCDAAGRLTDAHRPDLLVQSALQNDRADLGTQPGGGGILTDVTNLGDEYTPTEARVNRIFNRLNSRIAGIIMGAADDAVRGVTEQLNKAKGEIDAEVAKLQEAGVSEEALAGLKSVSQSLDDRNPDAAPGGEESPGDTGTNPDGVTDTSE